MKGEMCILHRIVLRDGKGGYVMVSCDRRCPKHGKK